MSETFKVKLQVKNRIAIPRNIVEILKLKPGDWMEITGKKIKVKP